MYRSLLRLYPASFRNEYGGEMQAVFSRQRRDARSPADRAALWIRMIVDTCVSAALLHWEILAQDLRYAARTLTRIPGFALTVLVVVSVGVGATTAAFSIADFVLFRPLPFPDAGRLVTVREERPGFSRMELSPANYRDWKQMAHSFAAFAAYRGLSVNAFAGSRPQRLEGAAVTADLLQVLDVEPMIGRAFDQADDREGAAGSVLLSYALWQREFGGDASVVGTTVRLDDRPYTIIGVMPRWFEFPSRAAQVWTAMRFASVEFADRNHNYLQVLARLRPNVSLDAARAEIDLLAAQLQRQYPSTNTHTRASVVPLRDDVSRQARPILYALLGASACVLLIACANLANLLLARAVERRGEIVVRIALGAGRERLLRQLVTESLVLAGLGGTVGVFLAATTLPALSRLVPLGLPTAETPTIDVRVLAFAAVVTTLTGLAFSVMPLAHQFRRRASEGLREGPRAGGGRRERLRGALVVAEITASVVLLVMCGLLLRALWHIQGIDPGFTTESTLAVRTSLPMPKYERVAVRTAFYTRVLSKVQALPGVSSAAYISFLPMSDVRSGIFPVGIDGVLEDRRENQVASLRFVTPDLLRTLGIPLRSGRDVEETDTNDRQQVAVVSESFARRFFPGQNPLGRRFHFAGVERTIVGVVGDIKVRGRVVSSEPQVYLPHRQMVDDVLTWFAPKDLVIRTAGDPLALVPAVREIVRGADPDQPLSDVQTLRELVERDTMSRVVQLRIVGAFGLIALLLGGVGIHGVLAFAVSSRRAEIGLRMALGAQRADIVSMIAKRSLTLTAIGIITGVPLAYISGRAIQSLLVGVPPSDGLTFAVVIALMLAMAVAGSLRPALSAARVDPVTAIGLD